MLVIFPLYTTTEDLKPNYNCILKVQSFHFYLRQIRALYSRQATSGPSFVPDIMQFALYSFLAGLLFFLSLCEIKFTVNILHLKFITNVRSQDTGVLLFIYSSSR